MKSMKKISRLKIMFLGLLLLSSLVGCKPISWYKIENQVGKKAEKLYNRTLKKHGNATMLCPEGNFALVWYYDNQKIYLTTVRWKKKSIKREFECDSALNIKNFNPDCQPPLSLHWEFQSSSVDAETDSVYTISAFFDVDSLISRGSDCPVFNQLREHIVTYKMWR